MEQGRFFLESFSFLLYYHQRKLALIFFSHPQRKLVKDRKFLGTFPSVKLSGENQVQMEEARLPSQLDPPEK